MELPVYHIDAFTDRLFQGNPACVVPLEQWLPDSVLLQIAQENAVAETAFFISGQENISLRWFTPEIEMDLCGHATLATAHCLITHLGYARKKILFTTLSGILQVVWNPSQGVYELNFPLREPIPAVLPQIIYDALTIKPIEVLKSRDYILVYQNEKDIVDLRIDRMLFDQINLNPGGVAVTAKGDHCDFVSRFFTPQASILEDPVTGSAHCSLAPFWAKKLKKKELSALQLSQRKGTLFCTVKENAVVISGKAKTYSKGTIFLA